MKLFKLNKFNHSNLNSNLNKFSRTFNIIFSTVIMFFLLFFFFLYNAKDKITIIAGWITTIYLTFFYFLLNKSGRIGYYRKFLFILGAFCFFPAFIAMLIESRGSMVLDYRDIFLNETPFCHIVTPMIIIPYLLEKVLIFPARLTGHFASFYAMIIIICISILTIGRGWCSWVCFYGGWDETFSLVLKKPIIKIEDKSKKIRYFNFVILFVVILGSLATFSVIFCQWLCPWKLITEYEQIVNASTFFAFILSVLIFFVFVIAFSLITKKRVHCMSYCPFGALASILDKISLFKVKIDNSKCTSCQRCVNSCPTMSIDEQSIKERNGKILITCTKCGNCIESCPQKAIYYDFSFNFIDKNKTIKNPEFLKNFAQKLVLFSGWLLGSIIMGGFIVLTLARIINLFVNGSFFMN